MGGGPPCFPQDSSCPVVLKITSTGGPAPFVYEAFTLSGGPFQGPSTRTGLVNSLAQPRLGPPGLTTPAGHWPVGRYLPGRFGLLPVRSPLLRE